MSNDPAMPLAGDFPAQTLADWQALAAAVVNKARSPENHLDPDAAVASMRTHLPGGVAVDPLYRKPATPPSLGLPGAMPFTRGSGLRGHDQPWDVCAFHDDPQVSLTVPAIADDLTCGATSLWLHLGRDGIDPGDLRAVLDGIPSVPVHVSAAEGQDVAARALLDLLGADPRGRGFLGVDPLGASARTGQPPRQHDLTSVVRAALEGPGRLRAVTVDSRCYRDAGADTVDEVAIAVATGVAYLRWLDGAGLPASSCFDQVGFRFSATTDQFVTIASLRALRRLWARVGQVLHVPERVRGAHIHAVTSEAMYARQDPMTNVLRATLAGFGAAVGGGRCHDCFSLRSCVGSARGGLASPRTQYPTPPRPRGQYRSRDGPGRRVVVRRVTDRADRSASVGRGSRDRVGRGDARRARVGGHRGAGRAELPCRSGVRVSPGASVDGGLGVPRPRWGRADASSSPRRGPGAERAETSSGR